MVEIIGTLTQSTSWSTDVNVYGACERWFKTNKADGEINGLC